MDRRYQLFTLKNVPAPNFLMTALELKDYIDFPVKRVYFIGSPINEYKTGSHAHRADEDELFIQVQGSCTIVVDDGHGLEDIKLEGPKNAIYVPHLVWHGFRDMSPDSLICAVTSTNYDPERKDYLNDYEEFKSIVNKT